MNRRKIILTLRVILTLAVTCFGFTRHAFAQGRELDTIRIDTVQSKYIYLTFDDGPLKGSERIDSIVLAERVNISVFLVGILEEQSKLLQSYVKLYEDNPYIEMYNHSYSHANEQYVVFYSNPENVLSDIRKNDELYKFKNKIVRLPGRNMWRLGTKKRDDEASGSTSADLLAENGYKLFGWDLEWKHNAETGLPIQTSEELALHIARLLEGGETFTPGHVVVLMHDEMFGSKLEAGELKELIAELKKNNSYIFAHISSYPIDG